jgi:hypothetical protein
LPVLILRSIPKQHQAIPQQTVAHPKRQKQKSFDISPDILQKILSSKTRNEFHEPKTPDFPQAENLGFTHFLKLN